MMLCKEKKLSSPGVLILEEGKEGLAKSVDIAGGTHPLGEYIRAGVFVYLRDEMAECVAEVSEIVLEVLHAVDTTEVLCE